MEVLDKLRNLNVDKIDLDDAVFTLACARILDTTYVEFAGESPSWIRDAIETLTKNVISRRRDMLEQRLKEAKARRNSLRTAEEKRSDTDAEIERLEKTLGT